MPDMPSQHPRARPPPPKRRQTTPASAAIPIKRKIARPEPVWIPIPGGIPGGVPDPQPNIRPEHEWGCICDMCEAALFTVIYGREPPSPPKLPTTPPSPTKPAEPKPDDPAGRMAAIAASLAAERQRVHERLAAEKEERERIARKKVFEWAVGRLEEERSRWEPYESVKERREMEKAWGW